MGRSTTGPVWTLDFVPMAGEAVPTQPHGLERRICLLPGGRAILLQLSRVRLSAPLVLFWLAVLFVPAAVLVAGEPLPQVSKDGLELRRQTKQRVVYVKPGATVPQDGSVAILDPYIEFSKTWVSNYNSTTRGQTRRITDQDLERAKADLSTRFKEIFREELTQGGYHVGDGADPGVLVLKPALVNIQVNAPDLMSPGRTTTYVQSAGQMTLYLELWDGATSAILARVVDAQSDSTVYAQRTNSVTNKAAADGIIRDWARELRAKLDLASGKATQ